MAWSLNRISPNVHEIIIDCEQNRNWEQWVLLRSDVHHDNPKCDQEMERRHLKEALDHDAPVIDNGDLFCAMQGRWDKRADKSALREEHQGSNYFDLLVDTAGDFYEPYVSVMAILGRGNHETAITKAHETDLTDRLSARLRAKGGIAQSSGYGGWVMFRFVVNATRGRLVKDTVTLYHYHGTGGGGPVTRGTIQTNRISVMTPDPNIILTGHTHDEWQMTIPRQRLSSKGIIYHDEQLHIRCPGYKDAWGDGSGGWETERMLGPKAMGSAWIRFWYDKKHEQIRFDSVRAK